MSNQSKNIKSKLQMPQALALPLFGICALSLPAYAQSGSVPGISLGNSIYGAPGTTSLRDPLVPGAQFSLPGVSAIPGAIPALGSGPASIPQTQGMMGPSSLIPWTNGTAGNPYSQPTNQVVIPANQIDQPNNQISLPISNSAAMAPGTVNAQIGSIIPHAPSTPGADPGMLRPPSFNNGSSTANNGQSLESAGVPVNVDQNGQLPDKLTGQGPNQRNGRNGTADYGLLNRKTFGFRAQFDNSSGQPVFKDWMPKPGSSTYDSGLGVRALQTMPGQPKTGTTYGQLGSKKLPQITFDSPFAGTYAPNTPDAGTGNLSQTSPGNHGKNFASAQVTNDLYGTPMINPNKITTTPSGSVQAGPPPTPLTTIANY